MSIRKQQVYDFINKKKAEVIKEKVVPLREERDAAMDESLENLLILNGIRDTKFEESSSHIIKSLEKLRDSLDFHSHQLNNAISTLISLSGDGRVVVNNIDYHSISKVDYVRRKLSDTESEINIEFKKITSAVKSLSTGKQGVAFLKDLGFDTSEISSNPKNEVLNLKVNSELLGLPENKNKKQAVEVN